MNTNGKNSVEIHSGYITSFFIKGNYIYYINENYNYSEYIYTYELFRIKTNGEDIQKLADIEGQIYTDINFNNKEIYYAKEKDGKLSIYKIELDGKNEEKIIDLNANATIININKNYIYYLDNNDNNQMQTYRIKTNGSDKQKL